MKKIYYEKIGRRYVPVAEYNNDYLDSFPKGSHLVMCYPGGTSRRFNIDPAYAPMIAAGQVAENAISHALYEASKIRMQEQDRNRELTPEQKAAWEHLVEVLGDSGKRLEWASLSEVVEAGVKAMQGEAMKLMENDAVKKAYEQFMLIALLTKKETNEI